MISDLIGQPILYAVRHGETDLNAGNKFRGFVDADLDENGEEQAREARDYLKSVKFVAAYSSDLKRTSDTADTILEKTGIEPQRLAAMRPWHMGMFTGKEKNKANRDKLQWYADNPDVAIPEGESLNEFRKRYQNVFNDKVQEALDRSGPVLLVQHASNNHEIGNIIYADIDRVDVDPGGIVAVYFTRTGLEARGLKGKEQETASHAGWGYS
jgi:broad specificity phosphatase PhoE